jgi:hypothetical protein
LKVAAGVVVGALASSGLAWATIPSPDGTVTACYTKAPGLLSPQGSLRVVDSADQCRSNETAISWNQRGPQGPAGPKGDTGANGDTGPQGPQGPAGAGIGSLDDLAGKPCNVGKPREGTTSVSIDPKTNAVTLTCPPVTVLTVHVDGDGYLHSFPLGISCGTIPGHNPATDCSYAFDRGTVVTLTAEERPGYLAGFSGSCSTTFASCQVNMDGPRDVTAKFDPAAYVMLTVMRKGNCVDGSFSSGCWAADYPAVSVTTSASDHCQFPAAHNAPGNGPVDEQLQNRCGYRFRQGPASLTIVDDHISPNGVFDHWEGACTGSDPTCSTDLTQSRTITASYRYGP